MKKITKSEFVKILKNENDKNGVRLIYAQFGTSREYILSIFDRFIEMKQELLTIPTKKVSKSTETYIQFTDFSRLYLNDDGKKERYIVEYEDVMFLTQTLENKDTIGISAVVYMICK